MEKPTGVPQDLLELILKNVITVSEVTRTEKLSEILDSYANKQNNDIYTLQNADNKQARGIVVDLDYFLELIYIKRLVEESEHVSVDPAALDNFKQTVTAKVDEEAEKLVPAHDDLADIMKIAEIEL
ncbi:hypothetical protein SAMN03159341_108205 [Paenibacillus sp. 1_12]|uniref:hypothetical protein n=1 Tax=Paenibacillus sp. 1_12 TaxID=1566278 RepID=UPI0008F2661C|nr:hypothetical protein [Paenibacillus sp. 1_12]SFL68317.1 hypothetical protein SAMN03159341_108205 [Paenibacillus sp. 1_12]